MSLNWWRLFLIMGRDSYSLSYRKQKLTQTSRSIKENEWRVRQDLSWNPRARGWTSLGPAWKLELFWGSKGHLISFTTCIHESTLPGWLSFDPAFAHCLCHSMSPHSVSLTLSFSLFSFQLFFFSTLFAYDTPTPQITTPFLLGEILKRPPSLSTTWIISRTMNLMDFN